MTEETQNTQKQSKSSIVILILVVLVIIGVAGYSYFEKNNKSEAETTTLPTTESTTEEATEPPQTSADVTSLDAVSNSSVVAYYITEPNEPGFAGITIDFEPVNNADGYVLRYVYDVLDSSTDMIDRIYKDDTSLYFGAQAGPQRIDIRPFKENSTRDDIIYGEWYTVFNDSEVDYINCEELTYAEWNSLTKNHREIYP